MAFFIPIYSFANAQDMKGMDMSKKENKTQVKTETYYTCVMHPEIHESKPGNCPKCGMKLVKKTVKASAKKTAPAKMPMMKIQKDTVPSNKNMNDMKGMNMKEGMNTPMDNQAMKMDTANPDEENQISGKIDLQPGKTVRYDLYVKDTIVDFTGKKKRAIATNGQIPAPTLVFTEGDTAEIYLHNMLKNESASFHWHGVILPNRFDGVPYLTTKRIGPGETHLYKFAVVQNGTYWYHSHSALQEQLGQYGALIFKKRKQPQKIKLTNGKMDTINNNPLFNKEYTVVLSEWADEKPPQIQRRLRTGNDWFSIKKGSTQSYAEAIKQGYFKTKFINEWKRMKAMDVSDVYYDKFLLNGLPERDEPQFKAGDKVKLHVVDGGASSYFWLGYGGGKITVVGNDGNDMEPVEVDRLIIGPAETYDVIVTIPDNMSYEFRATSEDRTGYSSLWLGSGMKMPAPVLPHLKYFEGMKMMNGMMKMNGQMKPMEGMQMTNQTMDMNTVMYPEITGDANGNMPGMNMGEQKKDTMQGMKMEDSTGNKMDNMPGMDMGNTGDIVTLNYDMLRSAVKTTLPDGPTKVLHFFLTGNMNRYVWTINNKAVGEVDKILIKQGENVRIILTNNSMMRHPMHLHGHDFRISNSQGEYAPLKNVLDIMPMETDTIEFAANQSGNWFFHCHILYHMMAGMGRVFTYEDSPPNPELPDPEKAYKKFIRDNTMYHLMIRAGLESNGSDGLAMLSSNRYALQQVWHLGLSPHHGYESETYVGRYLGKMQWWYPYVGFDYHYKKIDGIPMKQSDYKNMFGQISDKNNRSTIVVGVQYTLPWLVVADARVDGNGKLRFQLGREGVPITRRLRLNFMGNTDKEYMVGFEYVVSKWFALSTHYDSDMGIGAGVTLTY
jgi:CopA family copper-resistance protein